MLSINKRKVNQKNLHKAKIVEKYLSFIFYSYFYNLLKNIYFKNWDNIYNNFF